MTMAHKENLILNCNSVHTCQETQPVQLEQVGPIDEVSQRHAFRQAQASG